MSLSSLEQRIASGATTEQRTYEGWAIVDVLGHQRFVGYVTTEYFGQTAFFHVVTPARDPRERVVDGSAYVDFKGMAFPPKGFTVLEDGKPASERFIGSGSIYSLTPTTRERVMEILEEIDSRTVVGLLDVDRKPVDPKSDDDILF